MAGIKLATMAAIKGGKCSLPEIIGNLHLCIINVDRMAYESSKSGIVPVQTPLPPGVTELPRG